MSQPKESFPLLPQLEPHALNVNDIVDVVNEMVELAPITGRSKMIPVEILAGIARLDISQLRDLSLDILQITQCLQKLRLNSMSDIESVRPDVYVDPGKIAYEMMMDSL